MKNCAFIAVQMGARHNYAIPETLAQHGILEAFYTDICSGKGIGKFASLASSFPLPGTLRTNARALSSRKLSREVLRRTRTHDFETLKFWWDIRNIPPGAEVYKRGLKFADDIGSAMITDGFGSATHVFNVFGEGGPFLIEAKRRGLTIITDMIIALSTEEIVLSEYASFPGWGPPPLDQRKIMGPNFKPADTVLATTDIFVCPSIFVQRDLAENFGVDLARTRVVPYAIRNDWFRIQADPIPGRVLFVGTADLRKGIHYLAMAAEELHSRGRHYDFRVAGNVHSSVAEKCKFLTFLGRIPRSDALSQFAQADVFVLPTLAEGSATVIYEAMACGVPVITTSNAGAVIQDGEQGLIVPARDSHALANAIEAIIENRRLRMALSLEARSTAKLYSWDRYARQLLNSIGLGDLPLDSTSIGG